MSSSKNSTFQIINTAILQARNDQTRTDLEERMNQIAQKPVMNALHVAMSELSKKQKISFEQAALEIITTIQELDQIWEQYLILEGSHKLKNSTD